MEPSPTKYSVKANTDFPYVLLITLASFSFFKPSFLEPFIDSYKNLYNYIFLLLFLFAVPAIVKNAIQSKNYLFTLPVRLLCISIILSMLMANFFWGQKITDSMYGALLPVFSYFFYFYLMSKNVSVSVIERIITILGIAFIIFFLVSFLISPIKIFEYQETNDRAFLRILLHGHGFLVLFYFFSLSKLLAGKSKLWLVGVCAAFLCIVLNQTRVWMVSTTAITAFYLLGARHIMVKVFSVALVVGAFLLIPQIEFVQNLQNKTQNDLGSTDDYVRTKAAKYYLNKFQPSVLTRIFGNGFANGLDSPYAKEIDHLRKQNGYFFEDVGFIGLYAELGVLALIAWLIIVIRALKTKLIPEYDYLKMFIIFLICGSFTTNAAFSSGSIMAIVFTLYLYEHCQPKSQKTMIYNTA
jgi:hypothetical protein